MDNKLRSERIFRKPSHRYVRVYACTVYEYTCRQIQGVAPPSDIRYTHFSELKNLMYFYWTTDTNTHTRGKSLNVLKLAFPKIEFGPYYWDILKEMTSNTLKYMFIEDSFQYIDTRTQFSFHSRKKLFVVNSYKKFCRFKLINAAFVIRKLPLEIIFQKNFIQQMVS